MTDRLPSLLDCAQLARELGIKRHAAEQIMRQLPLVRPDGLRKTYVKRTDVARFLERATEARHVV